MAFTSLSFVLFVAVGLVLYALVPKRYGWLVLLAVSLRFYLALGWGALRYLLFTALTTYAAGLALGRLNAPECALSPATRKRAKRLTATAAIVLNFGLLYLVKYWDFTAEKLSALTGHALPQFDLLLPLGLSFYMFQSVGYVIDCYRKKYPPQKNPLRYLLFVCFFPQMVQGPISRYNQLAPQLYEGRPLRAETLKYGIQLAMWGYLKKLVVADRAAVIANTVFGAPETYGGIITAVGVGFYCIQLYFDFSGGIDITRGVAQMFGIDLVENFRRPIFATSLADYWRRWHITLGAWMRDYVFYPLAFSKPFTKLGKFFRRHIKGKAGTIIPTAMATFVVYLIIGIWHGANFRYIFYGMWNGAIITASQLMAGSFLHWKRALHINDKSKAFRAFQMLRTTLLVFIGRYITRAPRLLTAFAMLRTTVCSPRLSQLADGTLLRLGLGGRDMLIVAAGVAVLLLVESLQESGVEIRKRLENCGMLTQWLGILLPLLALLFFGILRSDTISAEFIYKQF